MATSMQDASDHRKLALIIGNGDYRKRESKLNDSVNNARELSNLLKSNKFDVTTAYNLGKHDMNTTIIDFSKKITDGDLVLVYVSGHGYSVDKQNYIIPVDDDRIGTNMDLEDFSVKAEWILTKLVKKNRSYVTLLILDCCRPYRVPGTSRATSMSEGNGLYEMKAPSETFIQFACAPNQTTNNNLFTKHLLRCITQGNLHIANLFQEITNKVYQESNRQQKPFSMNGLHQHKEVYLIENKLSTEKFLSPEPLSSDEKDYYEDCKEYYQLTKQPLIVVPDEVFDNTSKLSSLSIKFGIDEDCNKFDLNHFLNQMCGKLGININDIAVKKVQVGSAILEAEIYDKFEADDKKLKLKMIYNKLTDKLKEDFGFMKVFFMFFGEIKSLFKRQKHRAEIKLNPQFNRIYARGHDYWDGPNHDRKDRGNQPYYCPVGWQRWSFYVTDKFYQKFCGWCICYHGTKFDHGLSILLSGLKPADVKAHGSGVYATPSVNYAAHPRYAEVKAIDKSKSNKLFKSGKYVQFVLECRVHPSNIKKIGAETLEASHTVIDPNISNDIIEWLIDNKGKDLVDFNDPNATIICTGILVRVTDNHPGLLPQSQWWYKSHLCDRPKCCLLGIKLKSLKTENEGGDECQIIYQ